MQNIAQSEPFIDYDKVDETFPTNANGKKVLTKRQLDFLLNCLKGFVVKGSPEERARRRESMVLALQGEMHNWMRDDDYEEANRAFAQFLEDANIENDMLNLITWVG